MRIIGDIHGKIVPYLDLLVGVEESIQIGDFGMGFLSPYQQSRVDEIHASGKHKFIRGNHDDPARCRASKSWIEDGHHDAENSMMLIGGAWSIDGDYRREYDRKKGTTSWWPDEQLTVTELAQIKADYIRHKPRIMITHDAPMQAAKEMFFDDKYKNMCWPQTSTDTAEALQEMFYEHQPELWIFGHWHFDEQRTINGTRFINLNELSYIDINLADFR